MFKLWLVVLCATNGNRAWLQSFISKLINVPIEREKCHKNMGKSKLGKQWLQNSSFKNMTWDSGAVCIHNFIACFTLPLGTFFLDSSGECMDFLNDKTVDRNPMTTFEGYTRREWWPPATSFKDEPDSVSKAPICGDLFEIGCYEGFHGGWVLQLNR